ncbi:MAG: hypothetical protein R3F59_04170 [Myxococcota bacterium]
MARRAPVRYSHTMWLIAVMLGSGSAAAADVPRGANQLAMGDVGAADARDNAVAVLNPGMLGLVEHYDFQSQFRYGPTGGLQWGASLVDARSSDVLSGGFLYSGDRADPPLRTEDLPGWHEAGVKVTNRQRLHDLGVALAMPLLERRLSFGLATAVTWYDYDLEGHGVAFDLDAGVGARPVDALSFGVAVRNLLPFHQAAVDRPTSVVGGVRVESPAGLAIEADAEWVPRQPPSLEDELPVVLRAGVQVPGGPVRLRAGALREVGGLTRITGGIGYERDGTAIEYGIQVPTTNPLAHQGLGASMIHGIQLRFSVPEDLTSPEF